MEKQTYLDLCNVYVCIRWTRLVWGSGRVLDLGSDLNKHSDESLFSGQFSSQSNITHIHQFIHRMCAGSMSALITQLALFELVSEHVSSLCIIQSHVSPYACVCIWVCTHILGNFQENVGILLWSQYMCERQRGKTGIFTSCT